MRILPILMAVSLVAGCESVGGPISLPGIGLGKKQDAVGAPADATGIAAAGTTGAQAATVETRGTTPAVTPVNGTPPPPPANGAQRTVAGLGDPSVTGLWLETPLVKTERKGRIIAVDSGVEATVTLKPLDGPATAGSRISLQTMQVLQVPLTELVDLDVYPL
ncbi:hypothetical protein [Chachezhania sediminis]|uniref:hypothetical protein n=1 Tax=Chachezhania sediminis TaxID=2599291 RepID=UPI00131C6083|nr:hypothetical protein [Chachezhania sediminis]